MKCHSVPKNTEECQNDYLTVLEGTGNDELPVIGTFCGIKPPAVATDTNKITLVFKSDAMFRYPGFKCRYRAIQPNGIAVINSFVGGADSGP